MDMVSGGQLTAEALVQKEVDTIFTLSGGHITPIWRCLWPRPGVA
jgi:thiamine pyrophosphate-dependent acetolactate synthase large subunit-like protein